MKRFLSILPAGIFLFFLAGCGKAPPKTNAELRLNAQQARGRRIFQMRCASCHHAYSSSGSMGPSLHKLFRRRYLPSGLPANDRFVEGTIVNGRGMMPAAGGDLTEQQLADLLAYLHTL
ncbi:MAG TPA: c-type cytochrome [Patescibacteria group bacterium]|nr:c-type cytochrome [Patescibacteria group bacterium]